MALARQAGRERDSSGDFAQSADHGGGAFAINAAVVSSDSSRRYRQVRLLVSGSAVDAQQALIRFVGPAASAERHGDLSELHFCRDNWRWVRVLSSQPKLHHFLPEAYLRRFADERGDL